ncbi:hypothetical protein SAMN05421640_3430 [Ekhidna lutea]|uniref:Cellobiose phosphorylase n=1 Tax=Ekhidna lutea TaxID=447679 RepID=A0A239LX89_EKHLU|nr:hypothetical protein [Ekhidna lutea]SNT34582.1 hypothetical protein SAMN05421640_3430 [Ekhidna lutea]
MNQPPIFIKELAFAKSTSDIVGEFVRIGESEFYKIENYDRMRPFFLSLVSHSDHWLFISTTGGLTAGRKNSESALFPYYTDDRIRDDFEATGSKTILRVERQDKQLLWEPFSNRYDGVYNTQRNLYKNRTGSKLIFEELNEDLQLTFQYSWSFSEKFGFVKKSKLINWSHSEQVVEVLDGIQNILPYGVGSALQASASNLVNAYKKNELHEETGLGLFMLSAIIVDKAEPSEALKTTTVWSTGLTRDRMLLSSLQLDKFRRGEELTNEVDVRAERGAYFINTSISLNPNSDHSWMIIAEVNQDHADVFQLIHRLGDENSMSEAVVADRQRNRAKLLQLVGKADGLQLTNDTLSVARHYSNVLFNIMRGGIFDEDYNVEKSDFNQFVEIVNKKVFNSNKGFLEALPPVSNYNNLLLEAERSGDSDLLRICKEYLPLTFSRRHGDPSRPWNKFTIATKDEDGNKLREYEGNWRDIFQNWEALAVSFPGYILSMITKFVNASTIDGYNPYRITKEGIDWETIEPDNPWSYIGYWGDHQIIYLQKLLEIAISHQSGDLVGLLSNKQFVYADVPYRIKGYADIVNDPQNTIDYDHNAEAKSEDRVKEIGSDGKLVHSNGELLKANLTEKLLVTFLTKMSNYVPEGGIWLNTQRPEWNDANNALVGNGVSMVTLYYMRRFASSMIELFDGVDDEVTINHSVANLFKGVHELLKSKLDILKDTINDKERKIIVDGLGKLGENYRSVAYKGFISTTSQLSKEDIQVFFKTVIQHIDHSIMANKREDGLYHSYNLLTMKDEEAGLNHLYEMLEGQVAVLSSGLLSLKESLEVLDALKASDIFREDQYSYMLYPNRTLPKFLEKNQIPKDFIESSRLAQELLKEDNKSVLYADVTGGYHFNGSFNNANSLKDALEKLKKTQHKDLVEEEYDRYLEVFEQIFNHKAFTGRSGTFYGYEGLGSIYWHMVSKLLVAVQENINWNWEKYKGAPEMGRMIDHYYEIRAGIGINKDPELYGSIPTDPYSHTPGGRGAQQPGMTGQVKEDILNRWAELGVSVIDSKIYFEPRFLSQKEFLAAPSVFEYFDLNGDKKSIDLKPGQLAFTYCQVPVIYEKGNTSEILVTYSNGQSDAIDGSALNEKNSKMLFNRTGTIDKIKVIIN